MGLCYGGLSASGPWESALDQRIAVLAEPLWRLGFLGGPSAFAAGIVGLATAAMIRRRGAAAVLLVIVGPLTSVVLARYVLKPLIGRTYDGELSLPSGHTTSITALVWVFVLIFVVGSARWTRAQRIVLALAAASVPLGVASAMIVWQVHYLTDTIAGALLATTVVIGCFLVLFRPARGPMTSRAAVGCSRLSRAEATPPTG